MTAPVSHGWPCVDRRVLFFLFEDFVLLWDMTAFRWGYRGGIV